MLDSDLHRTAAAHLLQGLVKVLNGERIRDLSVPFKLSTELHTSPRQTNAVGRVRDADDVMRNDGQVRPGLWLPHGFAEAGMMDTIEVS